MIATGTDIKPLEIVMFMRAVKSRNFFEQMKGRGVRVINPTDIQARHARREGEGPLRHRRLRGRDRAGADRHASRWTASSTVPFEKLLEQVAFGNRRRRCSSAPSRAAWRGWTAASATRRARASSRRRAAARPSATSLTGLVEALDPDRQVEDARGG